MIRMSRAVAFGCAASALALHVIALWVSAPRPKIEIEGGTGAAEVALGNSFADMVAGVAQPVSEATVTPNRQGEAETEPVASDVTRRSEPSQSSRPVLQTAHTQRPSDRTQAILPEIASNAPDPIIAQSVTRSRDVPAIGAMVPTAPVAPDSLTSAETVITGVQATPTSVPTPGDVVEANPKQQNGPRISKRPQARPRELESAAVVHHEPARAAVPRPTKGGNASRDARRGAATGREAVSTARQGRDSASQSEAQGNAAVSNYPGLVMRHLARVPRPRADTRGAALVQFTIAEGGALASVDLTRSSGSDRFDRAALDIVRRAAPFPAPPRAAQRRFSVQIKGR
ncbi:protein TonB [Roseovarius sp. MBR-78]